MFERYKETLKNAKGDVVTDEKVSPFNPNRPPHIVDYANAALFALVLAAFVLLPVMDGCIIP